MFTFKPAPKNGSNGNGHANGNGNGASNANNGNGSGQANSNGNGQAAEPPASARPGIGWLGFGSGKAARATPKLGNGHALAPGRGGNRPKIESVLGPGIHYQGTLTGTGGIRIEGTFDGTINLRGPLVIADGAKVTADIQASAVSVGGSLKGNITAGKIEILSTGRVWGDLITTAFATEEGAFLRGQVQMEDQLPAEAEMANEIHQLEAAPI